MRVRSERIDGRKGKGDQLMRVGRQEESRPLRPALTRCYEDVRKRERERESAEEGAERED